jgi:predicted DNA-binding transcriptional regulator YafY
VIYTERALTVLAYCCLREAFRMFRTDAIIELRAAGTSFRPRRVALLRTYLEELENRELQP